MFVKKVRLGWTICIFLALLLVFQSVQNVVTVKAASPTYEIGDGNSLKEISVLKAVMSSHFVYAPLHKFGKKQLSEVFDVTDSIFNEKTSEKERISLIGKYKLDDIDLKQLKERVYEGRKEIRKQGLDENLLAGWKIIGSRDDSSYRTLMATGFYGVALEKDNVIIIGFRGTEGGILAGSEAPLDDGDLQSDAQLTAGFVPRQYKGAKEFIQEVVVANSKTSKQVVLVGHSLGGWLVQKATTDIVEKKIDLKPHRFVGALTFNAPGFSGINVSLDESVKSKNTNNYYNKYITNYIINFDTVGGTFFSDHIGKRIVLPYISEDVAIPIKMDEHGIEQFYSLDYSNGEMIFGNKFKVAHTQLLTGIGEAIYGGRDWLDGGPSNTIDTLKGYAGNDTYIYRKGYGKDYIKESDDVDESVYREGGEDYDIIQMPDIPSKDVVISRDKEDLKISFMNNTSDSLIISRFFRMNIYNEFKYGVEEIKFSDGSTTVLGRTFPNAPKVNSVTDKGIYVQGTAEKDSWISIKSEGKEIASGRTTSKGDFKIKIPKQKAGTTLSVTAIDGNRFQSEPKSVTVQDKTPPNPPTAKIIMNQSTYITGTGEVGAAVLIENNGTKVETGKEDKVDAKGNFNIEVPKQKIGTKLSITLKDKAGNESSPTTITVQDKTAPAAPKVNKVTDLDKIVIGTAEAGTTVIVKAGSKTYKAITKADGTFTVSIDAQKEGTELIVTVTDKAGNVSPTTKITVTPVIKKITNSSNGNQYALIDKSMTWQEAKDYAESLGGYLATITSQEEQQFVENLLSTGKKDLYYIGGQYNANNSSWEWITGEAFDYHNWNTGEPNGVPYENVIHVYKRDNVHYGGKEGKWNDTTATGGENTGFLCEWGSTKLSISSVWSTDKEVTGKTDAGATVTVKVGSKTYTGTAKADGTFSATIGLQKVGTVLTVTAKNKSGNVIGSKSITVQKGSSTDPRLWEYVGQAYFDSKQDHIVLVPNIDYTFGAIWLKKSVKPPYRVSFKYKAGGGTGADGFAFMFNRNKLLNDPNIKGYDIEFDNYYNPDLGDPSANHIALLQTNGSNHLASVDSLKTEDNVWHDVIIDIGKNNVNVTLDGEKIISWNGYLDNTYDNVGFHASNGLYNNWAIIKNFKIEVDNTSGKDKIAPAAPRVNVVGDRDKTVTGTAEARATVIVKAGSKTYKGTVKADGTFIVSIDVPKAGTVLAVTAVDAAGNISKSTNVTTQDKTPPTAPSVNKILDQSTTITGTTEADATVYAKVGTKVIGSGTADKSGKFSMSITSQKAGTEVVVIATDAFKNVSTPVIIRVEKKIVVSEPNFRKYSGNWYTHKDYSKPGVGADIRFTSSNKATVELYGYSWSRPDQYDFKETSSDKVSIIFDQNGTAKFRFREGWGNHTGDAIIQLKNNTVTLSVVYPRNLPENKNLITIIGEGEHKLYYKVR